eukprot:6204614-Pleurochrysis_carterae.AAC.2
MSSASDASDSSAVATVGIHLRPDSCSACAALGSLLGVPTTPKVSRARWQSGSTSTWDKSTLSSLCPATRGCRLAAEKKRNRMSIVGTLRCHLECPGHVAHFSRPAAALRLATTLHEVLTKDTRPPRGALAARSPNNVMYAVFRCTRSKMQ